MKPPKKQLTPGRPKDAVNKANGPSQPLAVKTPKVPKPSTGELPKEVIGSHMGAMMTSVKSGPVLGRPAKLPPRPKKVPT